MAKKRMNKPPKKWWYSTVAKLKKLPHITDPAKAAGWLWYHHLTPEKKIAALTKKDLRRELLKYYTGIGHGSSCEEKAETTYGGKAMKKKRHKKKKLTQKQLKSLRQGRKILKHLRTGRKIAEDREPIIIKEGRLMAGKRKKGKKVKHTIYGNPSGFEGKRGKKRGSRGRYMHGASEKFNIIETGADVIGLIGGAVIGSAAGKFTPIKNNIAKSLVPFSLGIIGIAVPLLSKMRFVNRLALGSLTIGGMSLLRIVWPAAPLLAGETAETVAAAIDNLDDEQRAIMGLLPAPETAGEGDDEFTGEMPASETAGEDGRGDFEGEDAPLSPAHMG
jgi:hypothetical protein